MNENRTKKRLAFLLIFLIGISTNTPYFAVNSQNDVNDINNIVIKHLLASGIDIEDISISKKIKLESDIGRSENYIYIVFKKNNVIGKLAVYSTSEGILSTFDTANADILNELYIQKKDIALVSTDNKFILYTENGKTILEESMEEHPLAFLIVHGKKYI